MKYSSLILAVIAVPALAQTPAPTPQVAEAKPNPLDKVVCRTEETLGSRLGGHKVCATVREWQEQQQENRDAVELIQQKGQSTVPSG
ncbi:MAG: hypothetical protein QFB89_07475 [Pseudomonadota bacterium]|nr:hypothetical protein [Pseudomonadota bacterium]